MLSILVPVVTTVLGFVFGLAVGRRTSHMNQVLLAPLDADERAVFLELIRRVADAAESLRDPLPALRAPH